MGKSTIHVYCKQNIFIPVHFNYTASMKLFVDQQSAPWSFKRYVYNGSRYKGLDMVYSSSTQIDIYK